MYLGQCIGTTIIRDFNDLADAITVTDTINSCAIFLKANVAKLLVTIKILCNTIFMTG